MSIAPLRPTQTRPPRLEPLPKLPVFLDLAGRRAVVAGGGTGALWKAELLAAAGALVHVFAPDPSPELLALARTAGIAVHPRPWQEDDLDGAAIAIGEEEAGGFSAAARTRGVPVSVIDSPQASDFQFGAIVNRAPIVVAISTDGAAPVLAQAIRRRIEAVLPPALAAWARAAHAFRRRAAALIPDPRTRRGFWERLVDAAFTQAPPADPPAALEALAQATPRDTPPGEVAFVGAGPGDPELLTLAAVRALQAADVIVYDRLVDPRALELGRREARRVLAGKEGHGPAVTQSDISALVVELAREGRRVVRLKGGDPTLFGRLGEELAACHAAGVATRVVPGITSASAAAAAMGLSLTHREHAQRVQFVTGHDRHGELPADLDWSALADPRATTVVYMGRRTAAELARRLADHGLDPRTPVAIARDVARTNARWARTDLARLAVEGAGEDPSPALILIGAATGEWHAAHLPQALADAA